MQHRQAAEGVQRFPKMRLNSVSAPYFVQFNLTFPGELRRVGACTRYSHSSEFKSNFPRFHNFRLYHRMKGLRWARREKYPDKENHEPAAEKGENSIAQVPYPEGLWRKPAETELPRGFATAARNGLHDLRTRYPTGSENSRIVRFQKPLLVDPIDCNRKIPTSGELLKELWECRSKFKKIF